MIPAEEAIKEFNALPIMQKLFNKIVEDEMVSVFDSIVIEHNGIPVTIRYNNHNYVQLEKHGFITKEDGFYYPNKTVPKPKDPVKYIYDPKPLAQRTKESGVGYTATQLEQELKSFLGVSKLPSNIVIHEKQKDVPVDVLSTLKTSSTKSDLTGFSLANKIHLIASNITDVKGTFIHEGTHQARKSSKVFQTAYKSWLNSLNTSFFESDLLKQAYEDAKIEQFIMNRESDALLAEETAAYYFQRIAESGKLENIPFSTKAISFIKRWFANTFNITPVNFTDYDMVKLIADIASKNVADEVAQYPQHISQEKKNPFEYEQSFIKAIDIMASRSEYSFREFQELREAKYGKPRDSVNGFAKLLQKILKTDPANYADAIIPKTKQNLNVFLDMISSPEYSFTKHAAANRTLNEGLLAADRKVAAQTFILGDPSSPTSFMSFGHKFEKADPKAFATANSYLFDTDMTGKGYNISYDKRHNNWVVYTPENKVMSVFKTREEARPARMAAEVAFLKTKGFSDSAITFIKAVRQVNQRALDALISDWNAQVEQAERSALPVPSAQYVDDTGKRRVIPLTDMINFMGDLEGTYMPRERRTGNFKLIAKRGEKQLLEIFSLYMRPNETDSSMVSLAKAEFNKRVSPMMKRKAELQAEGYTVEIVPVQKISNDTFDPAGLASSIESVIQEALSKLQTAETSIEERAYLAEIANALMYNVSSIYRQKGSLTSRIARSANKWEGYELNSVKAISTYGMRVAAGIAKRETARKMVNAFTGRDIDFESFVNTHPGLANPFADYTTFVRDRAVSAKTQPELYNQLKSYIAYILQPTKPLTRFIGQLKALTTFMFLSGRIGSAAINATNQVLGVPATISTHTKTSLIQAGKEITKATAQYYLYRAANTQSKLKATIFSKTSAKEKLDPDYKRIFEYIEAKGWDKAHFNTELYRSIQNTIPLKIEQFLTWSMGFYGGVERVNRATTIAAAFKAYKSSTQKDEFNLSDDKLFSLAKFTSDRAHGIYGPATKPSLVQKYEILDLPYTFQKFTHNYLLNMHDIGFNHKDYKAFSYMLLAPAILAGVGSSAIAPMVAVLATLTPGIDPDSWEEDFYAWLAKISGGDIDSFLPASARHGLVGSMLNVNFKGSMALRMPYKADTESLLGAPGGVFTNFKDAFVAFSNKEYFKAAEKLFPSALSSPIKGYREYTHGVSTPRNTPMYFYDDAIKLSEFEFLLRLMSFNPSRPSAIREVQWNEKQVQIKYEKRRQNIIQRLNLSLMHEDPEDLPSIYKDIQDYNNDIQHIRPAYQVPEITDKWISDRFKAAGRVPKHERLRHLYD